MTSRLTASGLLDRRSTSWTPERRLQKSLQMKGKPKPPGFGAKLSAWHRHYGLRGSSAWAWRGGISFLPYPAAFNSQLKKRILLRDNFECQECGCSHKLHVHHINYNKLDCREGNLIVLCCKCHGSTTSGDRTYWKLRLYAKLQTRGIFLVGVEPSQLVEDHIAKKPRVAWNKGLHGLPDYMPPEKREKLTQLLRSRVPWNKGLTTQSDPRCEKLRHPCTEQTKLCISNANKGRSSWCKGLKLSALHPISAETRLKLSLARRGRKFSDAHRAAMRDAWVRRKERAALCA